MSVREEDRQRSCPSRGLGVAAAAIGVGVGAALYYYFNKRSENPDGEGSTSNWSCEQPHTLQDNQSEEEDSYTTISEHSTTDTSMHISTASTITDFSMSEDDDTESNSPNTDTSTGITDTSASDMSIISETSADDLEFSPDSNFTQFRPTSEVIAGRLQDLLSLRQSILREDSQIYLESTVQSDFEDGWRLPTVNLASDSDVEWDITPSSADVPNNENDHRRSFLAMFADLSPRLRRRQTVEDPMSKIRDQAFRERDWSREECSICFEVMLDNQEVMALPCTHRFHQPCLLPWLQEKQTCPNCRKMAECKFI